MGVEPNNAGVHFEVSKNLCNGSFMNAYIGGTTGYEFIQSSTTRTMVMKCEPNTIYTISKTASARFTIGVYSSYITSGTLGDSNILFQNHALNEATIATKSDSKYLYIYVSNASEEPKIMVEKGSVKHDYEPYISPSIKVNNNGVYETIVNCGDTDWIDMSDYVNKTNFTIRSTPMVRKIGNVVYWRGEIYCTTAPNNTSANIMTNIPQLFRPSNQHSGGSNTYSTLTPYNIFISGDGTIIVKTSSNITVQSQYNGFQLTNISGYLTD